MAKPKRTPKGALGILAGDVTDNVTIDTTPDVTGTVTGDTTVTATDNETVNTTSDVGSDTTDNVDVTVTVTDDTTVDTTTTVTDDAAPNSYVIRVPKKQPKNTYEDCHTRKTYYINNNTLDKIAQLHDMTGMSQSEIINRALDEFFARVEVE